MLLYPNAKINLGLAVVCRRADGYHDLETVFVPVPGLHDVLEVHETEPNCYSLAPYSFRQEGISVDCAAEDNLIVRTYLRMRERYPQIGGVDIRFRKNIPFGAGLGGGSADAAFMAKALNRIFDLQLTDEQLEAEVAPMGADCPFFIQNRTRFAQGIGNVFSDPEPQLLQALSGKWLLLVKPPCAVSTGQAYRGILTREVLNRPSINWHSGNLADLTNDFEQTVFPLFPEIAACKQQLLNMGACYASMSGSGATVFGLFDHEPDASHFAGCFTHCEQLQ